MENEKIWIKDLKEQRLAYLKINWRLLLILPDLTYRILKQARQSLLNR